MALGSLFVLAFFVVPFPNINIVLRLFHLTVPPILLYVVVTLALAARQRQESATHVFTAFLLLTATVIWDIADDMILHTGLRALPFSFLGYLALVVFTRLSRGESLYPRQAEKDEQKYKKSKIKGVDVNRILQELDRVMDEDKAYCDEDLTLGRLAETLEVSAYQLSEILNIEKGASFASYVNEYRIGEARRLLQEEEERSVLSIAYAVGFNSKSRFNAVFKQITGNTPSQFRKRAS